MQTTGWIGVRERYPTAEDADACGCVLVWHIWQGVMVMCWHQVAQNRFVSHWTHTLQPPEDYKELRETWEQV